VGDALAVRDRLVGAGFDEVFLADDSLDWHQLVQVFTWKGTRLEVDVHKAPKWPFGLRRPPTSTREVLDASVHSGLGVAGISAPAPHHHALILAAHAWSHEPLWRLRDLIDIAVVSARADERDMERTAAAWEIGRLWRSTQQAIEAVFYNGHTTLPIRTWARHLEHVRERSAFERRVTSLVHGYWGMSPQQGLVQTLRAVRHIADPVLSEATP
jgi:hypothetical protein